MEGVETARVVRLPTPEKDGWKCAVRETDVVELERRLSEVLEHDHAVESEHFQEAEDDFSLEYNSDHNPVVNTTGTPVTVVARCDARTSTCYNCRASMEATAYIIVHVAPTEDQLLMPRYCEECATAVREELEQYIEDHADSLIGRQL